MKYLKVQFGESRQIKNHQTLHYVVFTECNMRGESLKNADKSFSMEESSHDKKISLSKTIFQK